MEKRNFANELDVYVQNLTQELANGGSTNFKKFLAFSQNFRRYSLNNRLMIRLQMPEATFVASYRKWQSLNRQVKAGSQSIKIWGFFKEKSKDESEREENRGFFRLFSVFDVSQTEGEEIPEWSIRPSLHDDKGLYQLLSERLVQTGIKVEEKTLDGSLGVSYGGLIEIEKNQTIGAKFLTLIHEAAHEFLHKTEEGRNLPREIKECQAEATAYIVASKYGLQDVVSAEYILHWGNDEKTFKENLAKVLEASEKILDLLEEKNNNLDNNNEA